MEKVAQALLSACARRPSRTGSGTPLGESTQFGKGGRTICLRAALRPVGRSTCKSALSTDPQARRHRDKFFGSPYQNCGSIRDIAWFFDDWQVVLGPLRLPMMRRLLENGLPAAAGNAFNFRLSRARSDVWASDLWLVWVIFPEGFPLFSLAQEQRAQSA